jgi:hypothetical protein
MNKFNSLNASQRQLGATISNTTVRKSAGQYGYVLEVTVDPDESRRLGERLRSMSLDKVLPQFDKDPDGFEKTSGRLLPQPRVKRFRAPACL